MKIVVFGATGGTGIEVVKQALELGYWVTAVARRPEAVQLKHERLSVLRGDVFDPASIKAAMQGQDIVVSALGVQKSEPTTLYSEGVCNIMKAMQELGLSRLICVSASGLNPGPLLLRLIAKPLLWFFFKEAYTDMWKMEQLVQASSLDWTIVRPPRLSDKPVTGRYQVATNWPLSGGYTISRADVAHYIVHHLEDRSAYPAIVEIGY
jgi:putative NADH-flavin reductase